MEGIYFLVVFEEVEEFYTKDKNCNEDNKEKIGGFRKIEKIVLKTFLAKGS